ncbi:L-idonate 5-dehydrogenase [Devosia sp. UYZn731]|uniref:L-idonate 5-dehydrogenase n=1 Tax=Devosia sp. UYZn731 TaxID=3156345 RepID=UPI00339A48CF
MKAFVLHGQRDLRAELVPTPIPGPGEVLVRVRRAGICGSDIHYFVHGRVGSFVPKRPFILGHEIAGEVAELGPGVDAALGGRRVAVDPSIPCGACAFCREGRYNLCINMRFYGSASADPHVDGGFAEYVLAPAANCHVLPDGIGWAQAAMTEPLSVAVHAVMRSGGVAGKSVLVTGGGAIGQLTALAARAFGASTVVLADIAAFPRDLAVQLGADASLDAADPDAVGQGLGLVPGGFHVVLEASGAPPAVSLAIALARRGGTIVQIGTLPAKVTAPLNTIMARELSYVGSFRFANVFGIALDLMASGRVDVSPLVNAVMPLDEMAAAMDRAIGKDGVIKVQVEP